MRRIIIGNESDVLKRIEHGLEAAGEVVGIVLPRMIYGHGDAHLGMPLRCLDGFSRLLRRGGRKEHGTLPQLSEPPVGMRVRSEEHTSELQSQSNLVCRLLLENTT